MMMILILLRYRRPFDLLHFPLLRWSVTFNVKYMDGSMTAVPDKNVVRGVGD
jgi:hypothetical protein